MTQTANVGRALAEGLQTPAYEVDAAGIVVSRCAACRGVSGVIGLVTLQSLVASWPDDIDGVMPSAPRLGVRFSRREMAMRPR